MSALPPQTVNDLVVALVSGAPALAIAVGGYLLHRRDCKEVVSALREDNARLLEALKLALDGRPRP